MLRRSLLLGALFSQARRLSVAYAGSMTSLMEGPVKRLAADELGINLEGRAQGASGLAQLIIAESIHPDVFISITPGPMQAVLKAGKAHKCTPLARTEMVIAYNPQSRFAADLKSQPWHKVLQSPGLRFGRTDPATDPQGRNILFCLQLASDLYHQADLKERIAGPDLNPSQIFAEPSLQSRLQSGELDAASAYKIQPEAFHLPYVTLPEQINLGSDRLLSTYQRVSLTFGGRTYKPEPLIYYAAVLNAAENRESAERFVAWLEGPRGQGVLRQFHYDPA